MKRTQDALDIICSKDETKRLHTRALLRLHKGARVALDLQFKALLLFRDQEWWERTQADEGLRKRNCEATRKYRHGTNVPKRRWENTLREGLWSELEAERYGRRRRMCTCHNDAHKLQNLSDVAAREAEGARRTTGEWRKAAETSQEQKQPRVTTRREDGDAERWQYPRHGVLDAAPRHS